MDPYSSPFLIASNMVVPIFLEEINPYSHHFIIANHIVAFVFLS